jgi:hypothetical protein
MVSISYVALILLIGGCLAAGVTAAMISTWSLRARLYTVESELAVVSAKLMTEIKARAGQERWKKPDRELELLKMMQSAPAAPARKLNWWEDAAARANSQKV